MADPSPLVIAGLGGQGDGLVPAPGGDIFVADALPGESVTAHGDSFARIGAPSPDRRTEPLCPHVGDCGGCSVQHMGDALYATWKSALLRSALAQQDLAVEPAPMRAVPLRSRRRAALAGSWRDGRFVLGFHRKRSHDIVGLTACAVLTPGIVAALPALAELAGRVCRPGEVARLQVLAADNGLDVAIERAGGAKAAMKTPIADLARLAAGARIVRLTLDGELAVQSARPVLAIAGAEVVPPPGAFVQAARETDAILGELVAGGLGKARRAADLFAGLGTLTFAMARRAAVTAVDSEAALLAALGEAAARTPGLKPVTRLRRDLARDPLSPRELAAFDAVVLDPPRAGAQAQAGALAQSKVARVIMVSCNPATLARDLRILVDGGYSIETATPVDQFLFTAHLEAVAVLRRR